MAEYEFKFGSENVTLQQSSEYRSHLEIVLRLEGGREARLHVHKAVFLKLCAQFLGEFADEVRPWLSSFD